MKKILFFSLLLGYLNTFAQIPDLGKLKSSSSSIRYFAIGSSLSAGVRDGGLSQSSQLTSFPNILALQMGIENFKQPVFEASKSTSSIQKNNGVPNKTVRTSIVSKDEVDGEKVNNSFFKISEEVNNLAIPYQKLIDIFESNEEVVSPFYDNRSFNYLNAYENNGQESKISYLELLPKRLHKADFFTFELGLYDYVQYINSGALGTYIDYMVNRESNGELVILYYLAKQNLKGVIANVPDALDFPIFKLYTLDNLRKLSGNNAIYISHWSKSHVREAEMGDVFLPKSSVLSLTKAGLPESQKFGLNEEKPLQDEDVLDVDEQRSAHPEHYNNLIKIWSEKYNWPIVDLYTLYKKILKGDYITDDGIRVDPSYPNGNFFSSDGINPTAFGQAIIANEFIKTTNSFYNSNIPFVSTKQFLK